MPVSWKTVRVFISSTFRDMEAERDWLVRFVFPRLREELLARRVHLFDVDLRWGVTSDRDILGACREIIDECRPYFVCMLGERYGETPVGQSQSIAAEEVHYGALNNNTGSALCYFRDPRATAEMIEEQPGDFREPANSNDAKRLATLKQTIEKAGLLRRVYPARWDDSQRRLVGLEEFGECVYRDLLATISAELGPTSSETLDELAEEAAAMEAFIQNDSDRYVLGSREPILEELKAFATGSASPNVLLLTGDSGLGKTALLAHFCRVFPPPGASENTLVIPHFVGATANSTDLHLTLLHLCHRLRRALGETSHNEVKDPVEQLPILLSQVALKQKVVLVIDAINQLSPTGNAHSMLWLPKELPVNIRVVLSGGVGPNPGRDDLSAIAFESFRGNSPAMDDYLDQSRRTHPTLEAIRSRGESVREIDLSALTKNDFRTIVHSILHRHRKQMEEAHIEALLDKPDIGSPLYVLTAMEELRSLATHQGLMANIAGLPGTFETLLVWILEGRLSTDPGFRDEKGRLVGPTLVQSFVTLLSVSRNGLSMVELTALLAPGDPLGNVAALRRFLRPFLTLKGELLSVAHSRFLDVVNERYFATGSTLLNAHRALATLFQRAGDPHGNRTWSGQARSLSELPHHLTQGRLWGECVDVLKDDRFRERCMAVNGPRRYVELFEEFTIAAGKDSSASTELQRLALTLPVNEHTTWLLRRISASLQRDPDAAARLLTTCAGEYPDHDRSVIPLQALCESFRKDLESLPDAIRKILQEAEPHYFGSRNKRVRWEAAHNYGILTAETSSPRLLKLAESTREHPLVRAEAARQLGQVGDAELSQRLLHLATNKSFPLNRMAARSARRVQARLGLIEQDAIDDWNQAVELPDELGSLLTGLGASVSQREIAAITADTRIILHIIGSNTLSMEERWREVEILETVLRRLPCRLVCVEGGTGNDNLTSLRSLATLDVWEHVGTRFFHDFGLSSEEYLQITSRFDFDIWGVEDADRLHRIYEAKRLGDDARSAVEHIDRARAICENCLTRSEATGSRVTVLITQFLAGLQVERLMPTQRQAFHFLYVPIELSRPSGDLFEMDANYVHSAL